MYMYAMQSNVHCKLYWKHVQSGTKNTPSHLWLGCGSHKTEIFFYFSEFRSYTFDFLPANSAKSCSSTEFSSSQPWQDMHQRFVGQKRSKNTPVHIGFFNPATCHLFWLNPAIPPYSECLSWYHPTLPPPILKLQYCILHSVFPIFHLQESCHPISRLNFTLIMHPTKCMLDTHTLIYMLRVLWCRIRTNIKCEWNIILYCGM